MPLKTDTIEQVRLDKWLWAVRIFKTRSLATEECKKGRVLIEGMDAKPSRMVKAGDVITVRKTPVIYTYKVTGIIEKRVSATLAKENYDDLTSMEELDKLKINDNFFYKRDRGTGRPTKRERRVLNKIIGKEE